MRRIIFDNNKIIKLIFQVAELSKHLLQFSWVRRNAGNVSVHLNHLIALSINNFDDISEFHLNKSYPELLSEGFIIPEFEKRIVQFVFTPMKNVCMIMGGIIFDILNRIDILVNSVPIFYVVMPTGYYPKGPSGVLIEELKETYVEN